MNTKPKEVKIVMDFMDFTTGKLKWSTYNRISNFVWNPTKEFRHSGVDLARCHSAWREIGLIMSDVLKEKS